MLETPASQSHTQSEAHFAKYASQHAVPMIVCPICDAIYAPSLAQVSFLQASPGMLESAFMSLCHFCFRCRRPACPQCWDSVHGVCGDCVRETNLSFRSEAAPLDGLLFRPLQRQEEGQQEIVTALLNCVKPGCFLQHGMPLTTVPAEIDSATSGADVREPVEDVQNKATLISSVAVVEVPQQVMEKVAIAQTRKTEDEDEGEDVQYRPHPIARIFHVSETVLTVLAVVLLLAIIVMVIAAQISDTANSAILQVLHVDIRAEVAYLVHLVQQSGQ